MSVTRRLSAAALTLSAAAAILAGALGPAGRHPGAGRAAAAARSVHNPPPGSLIWDTV